MGHREGGHARTKAVLGRSLEGILESKQGGKGEAAERAAAADNISTRFPPWTSAFASKTIRASDKIEKAGWVRTIRNANCSKSLHELVGP